MVLRIRCATQILFRAPGVPPEGTYCSSGVPAMGTRASLPQRIFRRVQRRGLMEPDGATMTKDKSKSRTDSEDLEDLEETR